MKQQGEIDFLIGQGRTAEVLRNLCFQILLQNSARSTTTWRRVSEEIERLFGVKLDTPHYVQERSEIEMAYVDQAGTRLDIASAGRGLQQTLLLLAHLALHENAVLLLDEPDAHLEILRQGQIYQLLAEFAQAQDSQIIAASHSEVILNEAADRDVVVAFLGRTPHRIDDRGSQLLKSLKHIGFEQYYQAEQTGWVLYLEGSTDLAMLRGFANRLGHPAQEVLKRPFVYYVANQPKKAYDHFLGLRETKKDLVGFALFDHIDYPLQNPPGLDEHMWSKREFENYLCQRETLMAWAESAWVGRPGSLLSAEWNNTMQESIAEIQAAMSTLGKGSPWAADTKVSGDFLAPLFQLFYRKLDLPNLMRKSDYHVLADFVPENQIDLEIGQVLDAIVDVSNAARPIAE